MMVHYRRSRVPGGTYFFTCTLHTRQSTLLVNHIDLLRDAFRQTRIKMPFRVDAVCVLPDHLHTIWTMEDGDFDYSARWRSIKSLFVRGLKKRNMILRHNAKGETNVWQRRFWEHTIKDDDDFARHVDYLHFNPVKHGLVRRVQDWRHSSFHRFVKAGLLAKDWAGGEVEFYPERFGE